MIIRDVVEEEKMVNSVANLNMMVSIFFVNIMDIFIAEITRVIDNNQLPT